MATRKANLSFKNFFIFNSFIPHKEGEENKKILFYYPSVDDEIKIRDIGLTEALIKFSGTFSAESKALHTQKTTQVFFQPEKNFWMVLTLNVPYDVRTKEGAEIMDYKGSDVQDTVYRAVLRQSYNMFKLLAGTFLMNFIGENDNEKADILSKKFNLFYSKYLLTVNFPSCDVFDAIRSIQYLPLEKNLFLRIHNFINMVQSTFPTIKNCIFLYNDQLIWSGINSSDMYSVHEYLVKTLFPKVVEFEFKGGSVNRSQTNDCNHYGTFLIEPESFKSSVKVQKIYITVDSELKGYQMIVYRSLNGSLCTLVDDCTLVGDEFYSELYSFIGPQLYKISSEISEICKGTNFMDSLKIDDTTGPKYLFVNELSLLHKGTLCLDKKQNRYLIPNNVMNLIADLYNEDKILSCGKFEEIYLKSVSDYWIVKKTSNWRQFFVIIHNSKATLLDITNEAKKIFDQETKCLYF